MIKLLTFTTVLTALVFPRVSSAENISFPTIRGDYHVCPNGKTVPKYYWRDLWLGPDGSSDFNSKRLIFANNLWDYNTLSNKEKVKRISAMRSEVIIGKKPAEYNQEAIYGLKQKMLNGEINIPTSYKSISMKPSKSSSYNYSSWIYKFKNSEEKSLTITRIFGSGATLTDNKGNIFQIKDNYPIGLMYCREDSINLRIVDELRLEEVTNEYGELIELPLIFWMVETAIKSEYPKSQNRYEF